MDRSGDHHGGLPLGTLAVVLANWPMFWIGGVGLAVVGLIVGRVMSGMGYGKNPKAAGHFGGTDLHLARPVMPCVDSCWSSRTNPRSVTCSACT